MIKSIFVLMIQMSLFITYFKCSDKDTKNLFMFMMFLNALYSISMIG